MPNVDRYMRPPLPQSARVRLGWVALCCLSLIFSPFLGFAFDGTVGVVGLIFGGGVAIVALSGLVVLVVLDRQAMRQIDPSLLAVWRDGVLIPPQGAPLVQAPLRLARKRSFVEISPDGVLIGAAALAGFDGIPEAAQRLWVAQTLGEYFVEWKDIKEWQVCEDSDGPNLYVLKLFDGGGIRVYRSATMAGQACLLLDAVRSIGRVPVRLKADVLCCE